MPYFELLATSTTCEADCIATRLTSTFSAEGGVRPRRKRCAAFDGDVLLTRHSGSRMKKSAGKESGGKHSSESAANGRVVADPYGDK